MLKPNSIDLQPYELSLYDILFILTMVEGINKIIEFVL